MLNRVKNLLLKFKNSSLLKFNNLSLPKKLLILLVVGIIVVVVLASLDIIPKEIVFPESIHATQPIPTNPTNPNPNPTATVMDLRSATTYQDDPDLFNKQAPVNDMSFVDSTTGRPWSECGQYANEWWGVDLGSVVNVSYIMLQGRTDCCEKRLQGVEIYLGSVAGTYVGNKRVKTNISVNPENSLQVDISSSGRYLYIRRPHQSTSVSTNNGLTVCKLYVYSS